MFNFDHHKNFAYTLVVTAPQPATSGLSLTVAVGTGGRFPTVPFNATVCQYGTVPTPITAETIRVTGIVGDVLTIARAQEGSTARSIVAGDQIFAAISTKVITDIENYVNGLDAPQIPYTNTGYPSLNDVALALDYLLYTPIEITGFSNDVGTVEIGTTVHTINYNWSYNKTPTTQTLSVGGVGLNARSYTYAGSFTNTTTATLSAGDGTTTTNASSSIYFLNKNYWGCSSLTSLTDANIIALSSEFATSRNQYVTISPSAQYIYFAYPNSFGSATFTVNGLLNTAWTLVTRVFINASGHSSLYNIYRSNNLLTGTYQIDIT